MKTLAVTSGKGGVGKTNVAINLGLALVSRGKRVLLFDADLGLANVDILFGLSAPHTLFDVVDGGKTVHEILVEVQKGLKVLPSSSGILKMERLSHAALNNLSRQLASLSDEFDVLLLDTGAGLTESVLFFATSAQEVLIVTTPDPTAITDAYAMVKVLESKKPGASISILVNFVTGQREGREVFDRLAQVTQRFLGRSVQYAGSVPRDSRLVQAVRMRKPVWLHDPGASASRAIGEISGRFDALFSHGDASTPMSFWNGIMSRGTTPQPPQE